MIRLTIHEGSIVQTLTIEEDKVFIGRLDSNTVAISHASVSRKHCMLRRDEDGALEVLDLNSHHGTRKNGKSIERASLQAGDELMLGDVKVCVEALYGTPNVEKEMAGKKRVAPGAASIPAREQKDLISGAHRTEFGEEVVRQLKHTPWWAISIFLHTLIVYLFFLVPFGPREEGTPFGALRGHIDDDFNSLLDDDALTPEEIMKDLDDELAKLDDPSFFEDQPLAADHLEELEESFDPTLPNLGVAPTDFSARLAAPDTSTALTIPNTSFGKSGAEAANRRAMALLQKSGGGSLGLLRRLSRKDVLVVQGHYDKIETILDLLDLKHEPVSGKGLERTKLRGRKVLIINCSNQTPSSAVIKKIADFVKRGGYLLTTDWALENVIKRAFPDTIQPLIRRGRNVITPNEVVGIHAVREKRSHFLMTGTRMNRGDSKWWLEESSYPIQVLNRKDVEVLVESDEMAQRYGASAVAVTFRFGKGRVFHMLGHFFQKEGNLRGTFSTQRLIANFLIAAVRGK